MTHPAAEPRISINGHSLTEGQAMTVRVALESFVMDLVNNGLGEDAHGKTMKANYLARISEIRSFIFEPPAAKSGPEPSVVCEATDSTNKTSSNA